MILGINKLLELVKENSLIENLCDKELNNPTGAGFDLRINEIFEFTSGGMLGIHERHTPETKSLAKFEDKEEKFVNLEPNKWYVVQTVEKVNCPKNLVGFVFPRSTLYRSGILLRGGVVDPGYSGKLAFGLINMNDTPFRLEIGSRLANISFFEVKGEANPYQGKWQGGRVSTPEKEKQI